MIEQAVKLFPTKAAFCRAIGMTPQFLSQIERGERRVPPRYVVRIAALPDCSLTVHDLRPDIFGPPPEPAVAEEAA